MVAMGFLDITQKADVTKLHIGGLAMGKGKNMPIAWMETSSFSDVDKLKRLNEVAEAVEDKLSERYPEISFDDDGKRVRCFLLPDGLVAHVSGLCGGKFNDLVIEYAENIEAMKAYNSEDGDLFPIDDEKIFPTFEDMMGEILKEVQS